MAAAVLLLLALAAVWQRSRETAMSYEACALSAELERLSNECDSLRTEIETLARPRELMQKGRELGLQPRGASSRRSVPGPRRRDDSE